MRQNTPTSLAAALALILLTSPFAVAQKPAQKIQNAGEATQWLIEPIRKLRADIIIRQKLQSMKIPHLEFPNIPLTRAIEVLFDLSAEYDPGNKGINMLVQLHIDGHLNRSIHRNKGINMLVQLQGSKDKIINFRASNLTMDKILDAVTEQAGFTWDIQHGVVVVKGPKTSP